MGLPGWDSIEFVSAITRWTTTAGIWVLLLLSVLEGVAYVYGSRKEILVAAAENVAHAQQQQRDRETALRHATETAAIQQKLDATNAELTKLQAEDVALHLSDQQKAELVKALSPFAGQKIVVWRSTTASDSAPLASEVIAALKQSNWDVQNDLQNRIALGEALIGIQVAGSGDIQGTDQMPPAIVVLIATLKRLGLSQDTLYKDKLVAAGEYVLKIGSIPPPG